MLKIIFCVVLYEWRCQNVFAQDLQTSWILTAYPQSIILGLWWQSATFGFYLHINIFCALLGVWAGHFARDHCKSRKMIPELFLYSNNDYYLSFQYLETMVLGEFLTWVSAGWEIIFWNVLEKLGWLKTTLGLDSASKSPPRIKKLQEKP